MIVSRLGRPRTASSQNTDDSISGFQFRYDIDDIDQNAKLRDIDAIRLCQKIFLLSALAELRSNP